MTGARGPAPRGMRLSEMLTLRDQTDEHGRLLLEDSAPKKAQKRAVQAGVRMRSAPSSYDDTPSRVGNLMNVSAYEALRHDTADLLDGFAWLTRNYLGVNPTGRSSVRALFDTTHLGLTLPLLLFYRADDPVAFHGRLPSGIASMFKASRGVFSATVDMLNRAGPPTRTITAAEVVASAEAEGHFVRKETRRTCASPTRLIERTVAVILTGEGADADRSGVGALVDFAVLWEFYTVQDRLSQALSEYRFAVDQLTGGSRAVDLGALSDRPVVFGGTTRTFGEVTESVLRRANGVQVHLNGVLGRSPDVAPIEFAELVRLL